MSNSSAAFAKFQAAEKVWQANLVAAFGKDACNARYDGRGHDALGYADYFIARDEWHLAIERERDEWQDRFRDYQGG